MNTHTFDQPKPAKVEKPVEVKPTPKKVEEPEHKEAVVFQFKSGAAVEVMLEGHIVPPVGQNIYIGQRRYTVTKIETVKLRDYRLVTIE